MYTYKADGSPAVPFYQSSGGPLSFFKSPREAALHTFYSMLAKSQRPTGEGCHPVTSQPLQFGSEDMSLDAEISCLYFNWASEPVPAHARVDVSRFVSNACTTDKAYNYSSGTVDVVDTQGSCGYKDANLGDPDFCGVGDPINHGSGNKYQTEIDYSGVGEFPLRFERYYNSQYNQLGMKFSSTTRPNWRHFYERNLSPKFNVDGTVSTVYATRADGKQLKFTVDGNQWNQENGTGLTLAAKFDETLSIVGWTLGDKNDQVEIYDRNGVLQEIRDRVGQWQRLTYDEFNRLIKVSDIYGKTLVLTYGWDNSSTTLVSLTMPDGGVIQYLEDPYELPPIKRTV